MYHTDQVAQTANHSFAVSLSHTLHLVHQQVVMALPSRHIMAMLLQGSVCFHPAPYGQLSRQELEWYLKMQSSHFPTHYKCSNGSPSDFK